MPSKLYVVVHGLRRLGSTWHWCYGIEASANAALALQQRNYALLKPMRGCTNVGALYEVDGQVTDMGMQWQPGSARFMHLLEDAELRYEWQALHQANDTQRLAERQGKKENWRDSLEPVRRAYQQAHGNARNVLLAQVVAYITKR